MSLFKTRSNYFKQLAINNKQVAHTVDGRNSFHRMNSEDELMAACANFAHFPCIVHNGFFGNYTANENEVNKRIISNEILVLAKAKSTTDMNSIEDTKDLTFSVVEEIISWMLNEMEERGYCGPFQNLELSSFSFNEIGPIGATLYGWKLTFADHTFPVNVNNFDQSKWYEEPTSDD
jgi:hypothetical protein